jgi:hypothetical protein
VNQFIMNQNNLSEVKLELPASRPMSVIAVKEEGRRPLEKGDLEGALPVYLEAYYNPSVNGGYSLDVVFMLLNMIIMTSIAPRHS